MSDGAIFLIAIFLIVLRVLYMLATQNKIEAEPFYLERDPSKERDDIDRDPTWPGTTAWHSFHKDG